MFKTFLILITFNGLIINQQLFVKGKLIIKKYSFNACFYLIKYEYFKMNFFFLCLFLFLYMNFYAMMIIKMYHI